MGEHPKVGARRRRRRKVGFTDHEMLVRNRGFTLAIPLETLTSVHYLPRLLRSLLHFTARDGIDITLRESIKMSLNGVVLIRLAAANPDEE